MKILVTGGTGFIGKYLICTLLKNNPEIEQIFILSRNKKKCDKTFRKFEDKIYSVDRLQEISAVEKFDIIINLAGEPIANKRWSKKQKNIIRSSRLEILQDIENLLTKLRRKPNLVISASAIGFYGSQTDGEELTEDDDEKANDEFTHQLCKDIEDKALDLAQINQNIRVCVARFGIVLGKNGGALAKMLPAFKYGVGGKIASGQQYMSWIHIHDLIMAINFLIKNEELSGIFNFTSPNAVQNAEFAKTLAKSLNRPALFDMPLAIVKLLFAEMGETLLAKGQNVYPSRLLKSGFKFKYPELEKALNNIIAKKK